jgi:hypothetical protein
VYPVHKRCVVLHALHRGPSNLLWQGPPRLLRAGSRAVRKKIDSMWYTKSPEVLCDFYSIYTIYKLGLGPHGTSWRATGCRPMRYTNTTSVPCCFSVRKCFLHRYSARDGMVNRWLPFEQIECDTNWKLHEDQVGSRE